MLRVGDLIELTLPVERKRKSLRCESKDGVVDHVGDVLDRVRCVVSLGR